MPCGRGLADGMKYGMLKAVPGTQWLSAWESCCAGSLSPSRHRSQPRGRLGLPSSHHPRVIMGATSAVTQMVTPVDVENCAPAVELLG